MNNSYQPKHKALNNSIVPVLYRRDGKPFVFWWGDELQLGIVQDQRLTIIEFNSFPFDDLLCIPDLPVLSFTSGRYIFNDLGNIVASYVPEIESLLIEYDGKCALFHVPDEVFAVINLMLTEKEITI